MMFDLATAKIKYWAQKTSSKRRGIDFHISFDEWYDFWSVDDRWMNRGNRSGQYVMARHGDTGPYAIDNVRCATTEENAADSRGPKRSACTKAYHVARKAAGHKLAIEFRGARHPKSRPVSTPDGVFESGALAADFYKVTKEAIYYRIAKNLYGFAWAKP